jgi:hypothetical protein
VDDDVSQRDQFDDALALPVWNHQRNGALIAPSLELAKAFIGESVQLSFNDFSGQGLDGFELQYLAERQFLLSVRKYARLLTARLANISSSSRLDCLNVVVAEPGLVLASSAGVCAL